MDIGVHEDGLVHISQICSKYIKHPLEAVKLGQVVKVRVLEVDTKRNRISLTMLTEAEEEQRKQQQQNPRPRNNNNRKKRENREKKGFDASAIRNSAFRIKKK